jgi:hypothetical protein
VRGRLPVLFLLASCLGLASLAASSKASRAQEASVCDVCSSTCSDVLERYIRNAAAHRGGFEAGDVAAIFSKTSLPPPKVGKPGELIFERPAPHVERVVYAAPGLGGFFSVALDKPIVLSLSRLKDALGGVVERIPFCCPPPPAPGQTEPDRVATASRRACCALVFHVPAGRMYLDSVAPRGDAVPVVVFDLASY